MDRHRARRKRTFFKHINPLERFDDDKFIRRYRIDKQSVREMAQNFGQSGFCSTRGDTRGAGLTVEERVCTYAISHQNHNYYCRGGVPPLFLQTWVFFIKIFFFQLSIRHRTRCQENAYLALRFSFFADTSAQKNLFIVFRALI